MLHHLIHVEVVLELLSQVAGLLHQGVRTILGHGWSLSWLGRRLLNKSLIEHFLEHHSLHLLLLNCFLLRGPLGLDLLKHLLHLHEAVHLFFLSLLFFAQGFLVLLGLLLHVALKQRADLLFD